MASPRKSDSTDDSSPPSRDYQRPVDPPVQPARPDPSVQRSRPPAPRPSSRARPCGYDCEFVERPPAQVQCECPVCLQVLRHPQQITCCGNSFCKVCIDRVVKKNGKPCPTCNAVAFSIFPNKGLKRTLGGFRVYCSNKDEGCEWVGELGDIERHLNSKPSSERQLEGCLFEEVVCDYCTCLFQRRYIHDHQSNKCPKRQFQCEHCGEIDSYENITEIHSQKCPNFPIACHQCGENVQRQEMDNHVSRVCPLTKVDCAYKVFGCEVRPARKDLPTHITERVADHTAMLAKSMRKVAGSATAQSNKLKNSVTELREHVDQLGRESAEHINRFRRESDERMNQFKRENSVELSAVKRENQELIERVIDYCILFRRESDDRINQLKRENSVGVSAVKRENRERVDQLQRENDDRINQLRRENDDRINQLRRENDEKFMVIKRQHFQHMFLGLAVVLAIAAIGIGVGIGIVSHRGDVKVSAKLEDSFASVEVQLQTEIDRKMTDFEKNKTTNAPWYSPPFYTHTHGYRMCIRVDANGNGDGAGTHVSVFLYLMPGMFDDDLEWPFQGDITIELVNRLNPTSNLAREIRFSRTSDPELVEKVTSGDRAASGWGWRKFIAHSELVYNADKWTQYLKHDSLIFRISKVTNVK